MARRAGSPIISCMREQFVRILRALLRDGIVENCEATLRAADGRKFWATGNLRLVDFHGRRVVLAGIADVTKQQAAQPRGRAGAGNAGKRHRVAVGGVRAL